MTDSIGVTMNDFMGFFFCWIVEECKNAKMARVDNVFYTYFKYVVKYVVKCVQKKGCLCRQGGTV